MLKADFELLQKAVATPEPLYSIFDRIAINEHRFNELRRSELPRTILAANSLAEGFPVVQPEEIKDRLQNDLDLLERNLQDTAHTATLPYLFQKYGWRIPLASNTEKYPDVAFCDSIRAAHALKKAAPNNGYLLVKGDLTGIQEYIYHNIQPKQAGGLGNLSKRLRARSILVSLLTDFVANIILKELNLDSWHLLFAGGGHFNLLLPDDELTQTQLKMTAESLDKAMRTQFGDRLELIVAFVKCGLDIEKNASRYFEEVNAERDKKKNRQHRKDLYDLFERAVEKGKKKEIRIGGMFPNQNYLIEVVSKGPLRYSEPKNDAELWGDLILAEFDLKSHYTLLAVEDLKQAESLLLKNKANNGEAENILSVHILALNNTNFLPTDSWKPEFDFPVSFGFRFLGKNAPTKPGEKGEAEIMDFEDIAKIGLPKELKKGEGFLRLGSLMLDVDNLGLVFSHGLGKQATLAQIITLSREMNYFFTAHFDQRARERAHQVYIVYSGGDDAFAVGKWDMLIRFAKVLREDFQKFTCYEENKNADVHFSAGIFMSHPHYPIGRFYRDTKSRELSAKDKGRNRVDVFDYTLDWGSFDSKIELGDQFRDVLEKGYTASGRKFSASFAYRIMQLVKTSYFEQDEWYNGQFYKRGGLRMEKFARNVANMRYLFARNGFSEAEIQKLTDELERKLTQEFLKEAFNLDAKYNARDYLVALNFAMLQIRSKTKIPTAHG